MIRSRSTGGRPSRRANCTCWHCMPASQKRALKLARAGSDDDGECCLGCAGVIEPDGDVDCECDDDSMCQACAAMGDGQPLRVSLLEAL